MTSGGLRHALKGLGLGAGVTLVVLAVVGGVVWLATSMAPESRSTQATVTTATRPVTQVERETAFMHKIDGPGPTELKAPSTWVERSLSLGWTVCDNVNLARTSAASNVETVLRSGGLYRRDQAEKLVDAALSELCPNGERRQR